MKKIIFFDIDNTIVDTKTEKVPPQTMKLFEELSKNDDFYLGIATGRGPGRLTIIEDILHFFDAFVLSNGAYIIFKDKVIYDVAFSNTQIEHILKIADQFDFLMGVSGLKEDALLRQQQIETIHLRNTAKLNPTYFLDKAVYQAWLASSDQEKLKEAVKLLPEFDHYFWTTVGVDLTINQHSKGFGIEKVRKLLDPITVISIGDGHNDIDMIEMADIGIAMGNSKFSELKEKADIIGPHVSDDKLYDFLKSQGII